MNSAQSKTSPWSIVSVFPLGRIIVHSSLTCLSREDLMIALDRHRSGDWGDIGENQRLANERALSKGGSLLSQFDCAKNMKLEIVTNEHRSRTLVKLVT